MNFYMGSKKEENWRLIGEKIVIFVVFVSVVVFIVYGCVGFKN